MGGRGRQPQLLCSVAGEKIKRAVPVCEALPRKTGQPSCIVLLYGEGALVGRKSSTPFLYRRPAIAISFILAPSASQCSVIAPPSMAEPQQVPLESLGVQELSELRQQLEAQVQDLMQGLMALQQSAAKFAAAGQSVEYLAEQKQGGQGRSVGLQGSGDHWPRWCRAWGWAGHVARHACPPLPPSSSCCRLGTRMCFTEHSCHPLVQASRCCCR